MSLSRAESKNLRLLLTRKGRRQQQRFLAEGVRLMEEALRFSVLPSAVYFAPADLGQRGMGLVGRFQEQKVACEEVSARQIDQLADTRTPQGIIGVFNYPSDSLTELYTRRHRTMLVCENVSDPGNLGTLLRSALAFDFPLVVLAGSSVEPYSPKVVRSSAGAIFGLNVAVADHDELATLVHKEQFVLGAATAADGGPLGDILRPEGPQRYALAIGSEATGLSQPILDLAAARVRIEHSPQVESLNAAVAGSILMKGLYDLLR